MLAGSRAMRQSACAHHPAVGTLAGARAAGHHWPGRCSESVLTPALVLSICLCPALQKYENNLKKGSLTDNTIMLWNDRCEGYWG
jgi:hypothetical protein